jgi:uncharacterized membrane protein
MNNAINSIWENTKRTLYAVLKWFVVSLIARIAFVVGVIVLIVPPAFVWGFFDAFGLSLALSIPIALVSFVAAAAGFGLLLDRIDPILHIEY